MSPHATARDVVRGGVTVLCSHNADVDYELRQGRPFRASLQRWGDIANVIVGATSAAELTGMALSAAGTSHFLGISVRLLAGFSTTPWGLLFSVGGCLVAAGSALVLDLALPWDERLTAIQRALDSACVEEVRGERFRVSTRLDVLQSALDGDQ